MKFRKILLVLSVIAIALFLPACSFIGGEGVGNKRLVSAMGFDKSGEEITLLLETTEAEGEGKVIPKILSRTGTDLEAVTLLLESESPRSLDFGHVSAIILAEDLTAAERQEIFEFLTKKSELPLSVKMVSSESALDTLSFKNEEGESAGYELSKLLERTKEKLGISAHSSLYEIQTARSQNINIYGLPFIRIENGGFVQSGMSLFADDRGYGRLDYEQTVVYALLRNVFEGGEVVTQNGVYGVSSAKTDIKLYLSGERLKIDITVKAGERSRELAEIVERNLKKSDSDIFGLKEIISNKNPELWKRIEKAYNEYYKNADISVVGE